MVGSPAARLREAADATSPPHPPAADAAALRPSSSPFCLPLLLLLLVGIWELGRIINVQIILNNAARDGARLGGPGEHRQHDRGLHPDQVQHRHPEYRRGHQGLPDGGRDHRPHRAGDRVPVRGAGRGRRADADGDHGRPVHRGQEPAVPGPRVDPVRTTSAGPPCRLINPTTLTAEAYWQCLVDDPFTVNTTLPGWSP